MIVVKLGGSVITDKSAENKARKKVIKRLTREVGLAKKDLILVHGAGSFGHTHASKYNLSEGFMKREQLRGFHITHSSVRELNKIVMEYLYINNVFSVSIPPISFVKMHGGDLKYMDFGTFEDAIHLGLMPVTFGDVVFDDEKGFAICSGDLLVLYLSRYFQPERVIFVIDEDGIFDKDPKASDAHLIEEIDAGNLPSAEGSRYTDVTGGMGGKIKVIKSIAEEGIDVFIINGNKRDRLYRCLIGKKVKGTHVVGEKT